MIRPNLSIIVHQSSTPPFSSPLLYHYPLPNPSPLPLDIISIIRYHDLGCPRNSLWNPSCPIVDYPGNVLRQLTPPDNLAYCLQTPPLRKHCSADVLRANNTTASPQDRQSCYCNTHLTTVDLTNTGHAKICHVFHILQSHRSSAAQGAT